MNGDRKATTLALLATFLLIAADRAVVHNQAPRTRQVAGFAIVFLVLGFLVEFAPKPAKYFALLFFVGVLLERGRPLFESANKVLQGKGHERTVHPVTHTTTRKAAPKHG